MLEEKTVKEIVERITEKSYTPGDWVGVSDAKVVELVDVINILESYIPEKYYQW